MAIPYSTGKHEHEHEHEHEQAIATNTTTTVQYSSATVQQYAFTFFSQALIILAPSPAPVGQSHQPYGPSGDSLLIASYMYIRHSYVRSTDPFCGNCRTFRCPRRAAKLDTRNPIHPTIQYARTVTHSSWRLSLLRGTGELCRARSEHHITRPQIRPQWWPRR